MIYVDDVRNTDSEMFTCLLVYVKVTRVILLCTAMEGLFVSLPKSTN